MAQKQRPVAVALLTVIDDNGEKEYNTVKATGSFYPTNNMDVLTYDETVEDGSIVNNMLTLNKDKVSVKRNGPVVMHQQFREHGTTENVYQHPHGNIHMETFTRSISYQRLSDGQNGKLTIDYTVRLNGQDERAHQLTLTIRHKEEGSQ
ncbi:DUF1934 domain-containing protein [Lentibacillus salinarum]|uniref:DUF1934 domain-containing protein n=1 Tax=Lentibacillus salinarum TaxID=446820 RepID=A0ABW3ZTN1_9BACI